MAKLEFMLMFICLTSMVVKIKSASIKDKRIERLEDQLFNIEKEIDEEVRNRRYDIRAIMVKLFEIEEEITNKTFTGNVLGVHAENVADISPADTITLNTSLIPILLRAFQTEKKLSIITRRHIDGLKTDLGNMTSLISELMEDTSDVHSKLDDVVKEVNEIRQQLASGNKKFASCLELLKNGYTDNGLYDIYPNGRTTPIKVYCDQTTDGGGWVVFQRRENGSENFYRGWIDYKNGFGNPEWEFWLGNEYLHLLTNPCCRELRIDMEDFENNKRYVKYGKFGIGPKATNYVLTIDDHTGDAGDSLSVHNGMAFSTHDKDNDVYDKENCAKQYKGAWWYKNCHYSNLNGHYYLRANTSQGDGVIWYHWKTRYYSLKFIEMMLR